MGDDYCEYIFNHEMAMRRLLSILRQSQSQCTDNECLPDGSLQPQLPDSGLDQNMVMIGLLWVVVATFLFLMRPASLRGPGERKDRRGGGGNDPRRDDSGPPPPAIY